MIKSSLPVRGLVALAVVLPLAWGIDCNNWSMRYQKFLDGVCVCNSTVACDTFPNDYLKLASGQAGVYRTTRDGERFRYETATFVAGSSADADLTIDASTTYQTIIGFGGAFTDAAAINVYKMNSKIQTMILDAYYSADGIQYTTGRIPISSTDFSTSIYSYDATVDDFDMSDFSIAVDKTSATHKLDLIHRVLGMTERKLSIFASSWAPPVWMTKENSTLNCHMKGSPGEEYWKALALYYSKFITAYENEGISIWAMTTQNEPSEPLIKLNSWQSLRFTTTTERDFIKKDLGPRLKTDHPNLKLIIMDDNKSNLLSWLAALEDSDAAQYVDGVGIHWYSDADFPLGIGGSFSDLTTFHTKYPNVFMLGTEAAKATYPNGLPLARVLVYVSGWTDWNLVLDTNGGPNWAKNYVDAPIIVDETNGNEIYKQPMYYVMGHFSKFLTPGSVRLKFTAASGSTSRLSDVDWTAFLTPEGQYVAILFNKGDGEETVKIMAPSGKLVQVVIRPTSIQTVVFNK
ncbi:putative glycosyl hydrolase family 30 protein [Phytophthora cinnamomi]|uniref:putative glycosyl hydrolase family 30 protein n=1 Tax=Phytophthora cinnamomi TaxID=4785 RepID=UPI00355A23C6|nr:putative glycosyl hydrolase family 30 protein [Phytophthora cinnamomi]